MNEDPTKAMKERLNPSPQEVGVEALQVAEKAKTPEDLLQKADEAKALVDRSVQEVLLVGKGLEVKAESEAGNLRDIDQKATVIGTEVNQTIDLVAKGQETSSFGTLLSKVRERISAIKGGVAGKIDAFKAKREQKAQERLCEEENKQKIEIINDDPILLKMVFDGRRIDIDNEYIHARGMRIVEKYSLPSLKLFNENPYIKITDTYGVYSPDIFNKLFTEENLKKCARIYPDKKEISCSDLDFYVEKFCEAPQWVQDIVLQERTNNGISLINYGEVIDISKTFDESQIAIFKKLNNEGTISSFLHSGGQLNAIKVFGEKIDLLTVDDIKNIRGTWEIDRLKPIIDLSPEDIPVFQNIRQMLDKYKYEGRSEFNSRQCLEIFNLLKQADGGKNVQTLFNWAHVAGGEHGIEKFIKENFSTYKEIMAKNQLARKANGSELNPEERMTLGFACDRIKRYEEFLPQLKELAGDYYFSEPGGIVDFIDSFEKDPVLTIVSENTRAANAVFEHYNDFKKLFASRNIIFSKEDQMRIFDRVNSDNPQTWSVAALETTEIPFEPDVKKKIIKKLVDGKPERCYYNYKGFEQYLSAVSDPAERQEILDAVFEGMKTRAPSLMLQDIEFPCTLEQKRFISLMKRIGESQSKELKNMGSEIASIVAKEESFEDAETAIDEIEKVFLRNNIPFVGKQFKIFEILYPNQKLDGAAKRSFVPSLKDNHSNNSRRLMIFKDLLHSNFDSLNVNLEQYLHILKDGQAVLEKFEAGGELTPEENQKLLSFCKKVNAMSENVGHEGIDLSGVSDEQTIKAALGDLRSSFGVQEGETIIGRFERTFLERIGIKSLDDALDVFDKKRQETDVRNREFAKSGSMTLEPTDLAKGFRSDYIDTVLDRGVYSPEFIGADTYEASGRARTSDATPLDTDMLLVKGRNIENVSTISTVAQYGDLIMIMKDRGQFKDELELVNNVVVNDDQRGIRTGFGSTQIEGFVAKSGISPRRMEEIKFSIAKKGFYIPIADQKGAVFFSPADFDEYRKVFAGIERYHGGQMKIDSGWKDSPQAEKIKQYAQTEANIESIDALRKHIFDDIQAALNKQGINLNEGKYAESILGASISDTGSTGRGSALDEGYDFDFAVKLDDKDWDKVKGIVAALSQKYSFPDHYDQSGMEMYRSKDFDLDGKKISLDIGFVKKSDVESFDTNDAIAEKYDWIKENLGQEAYLDAMTNIRFAKKTLKDAGCYKKGVDRSAGQQGGLGGIGVEHWIMQNNGDVVEAFRDFYKSAYSGDKLVSFEEFKGKYKIFSAGENIRNNMKAENFMYNMDEEGYKKMAELSKQFL